MTDRGGIHGKIAETVQDPGHHIPAGDRHAGGALRGAPQFEVTQATVSRDIKELGLVKILTEGGRYKYAYVENGEQKIAAKFLYMFRETVISIVRAENLVVIKTLSGSANTAALAIDKLNVPEIAGSVAGDDTILVVALSGDAAERVREKLQSLLD